MEEKIERNVYKKEFLKRVRNWEQSDCVEFITSLVENHPEVLLFSEVEDQFKELPIERDL